MHRQTFKQAALAVSTVFLVTRMVSPGPVSAADDLLTDMEVIDGTCK
jgi:hypothetical protein